jgi:uncharacterized membrane protein (UPF0127 family)
MVLRSLVAIALAWSTPLSAECRNDIAKLRGDWGSLQFAIEVADDPSERAQGLMFRETLGRTAGMLFVYDEPQSVSFWMKNTLIPLDMIFVDKRGVVRDIHHRAIPGDLTPISSGPDILAVLEINGGLAKRYGITPGTQMQHGVFQNGPAIWPCN